MELLKLSLQKWDLPAVPLHRLCKQDSPYTETEKGPMQGFQTRNLLRLKFYVSIHPASAICIIKSCKFGYNPFL